MESILVVHGDAAFRDFAAAILTREGYTIEQAASVAEARARGNCRSFPLILCEMELPDGGGLEVLQYWKEQMPETAVVMLAASDMACPAMEAMRSGAAACLDGPLGCADELRLVVARALADLHVRRERDVLAEQNLSRFSGEWVAGDPRMSDAIAMVRTVAATTVPVLLTGEAGAGKEFLARTIHRNSSRAKRLFVTINCGALQTDAIETALFGQERGAITGAVERSHGWFERAAGGTVLLKEIGDLDAASQARLLRLLRDHTLERVGGTRVIPTDVRVIASAQRDIARNVAQGQFREDLYSHLSAYRIEVPPLRERPADIRRLARLLLERAARRLRKASLQLTPEAENVLAAYHWPGNVRELENTMERVAILCDGAVGAGDLALAAPSLPRPILFKDIERQVIEDALRKNNGNRTRTARQLGISLRTLQYRLRDYAAG